MTQRTGNPLLNYLLVLLCIGAIVAAVLVVGPASSDQTAATRTAKAVEGVVQSTVSGSGNLQPASQLNLGFKTTGTVTGIYVKQGQYVTEGKLLATLDPQSAEVTLEQAKATLQSAEASLAREQETGGEGPSSTGGARSKTTTPGSSTAPARTPTTTSSPRRKASANRTAPTSGSTGTSPNTQTSPSSPSSSTVSQATREANIASARAALRSDELTVRSQEQAVADTRLYAPQDGTIVSLSGQVGEVVSASGTTRSLSGASSSSSTTGSSGGGAGGGLGRAAASASSSASNSSSSSSAFAVLSDLSSMQLVVALSESEIGNVKVGQIATVTVEAIEGKKLAAHVSEVATLSTSSSGVVSYDVTFTLDQMQAGLKPGMSATAEVVVKQAEGVSVPSSAISGGSVTVRRAGKDVRQRVLAGLVGNSSTIVLSGLAAGETVVLAQAMSTSSATSLTSRLGSRLGGLGGAGGRGGFGGGAGAAFFRGGG
ncbi:MAG TPA: HlyD family efflux transporter periplasmic adaptor subunit [Solirubrobacteraceae bacterium]